MFLSIPLLLFVTNMRNISLHRKPYSKAAPSCTKGVDFYVRYATVHTLHLTSDIIILIIPFTILRQMKNLSRSERISAITMFSLGFLSIICGGLGAYGNWALSLYWSKPVYSFQNNFYFYYIFVARLIEPFTAITVACVPALRKSLVLWRKKKEVIRRSRQSLGNVTRVDEIPRVFGILFKDEYGVTDAGKQEEDANGSPKQENLEIGTSIQIMGSETV